jgi:mannose-6-phosphate isomerase-like protein (cupin superfamily)
MTELRRSIDAFLTRLRRRYAAAAASAAPPAAEFRSLLAVWPEGREPTLPAAKQLPACDHLGAALAAGRSGPEAELAEALSALSPALAWTYGYPARTGQPDLSSAVAFSQIVGPVGFRRSDRLRLGLTLIAPETHYPPHVHPAIETYLVIAGTALWGLGAARGRPQPPGALILHPGGMAHAMQTGTEPLLAIWSWRGDVTSPSVYLED